MRTVETVDAHVRRAGAEAREAARDEIAARVLLGATAPEAAHGLPMRVSGAGITQEPELPALPRRGPGDGGRHRRLYRYRGRTQITEVTADRPPRGTTGSVNAEFAGSTENRPPGAFCHPARS
jgi:hypothetical protein